MKTRQGMVTVCGGGRERESGKQDNGLVGGKEGGMAGGKSTSRKNTNTP